MCSYLTVYFCTDDLFTTDMKKLTYVNSKNTFTHLLYTFYQRGESCDFDSLLIGIVWFIKQTPRLPSLEWLLLIKTMAQTIVQISKPCHACQIPPTALMPDHRPQAWDLKYTVRMCIDRYINNHTQAEFGAVAVRFSYAEWDHPELWMQRPVRSRWTAPEIGGPSENHLHSCPVLEAKEYQTWRGVVLSPSTNTKCVQRSQAKTVNNKTNNK